MRRRLLLFTSSVTAKLRLYSWSVERPLDAAERTHPGKRLDYALYRGLYAEVGWRFISKDANVIMVGRVVGLGVSLSAYFGVEAELVPALDGVSASNDTASTTSVPVLSLPVPPPIARTRVLIPDDALQVLHSAILVSYAASTTYLTAGLACGSSLLALAVGWVSNTRRVSMEARGKARGFGRAHSEHSGTRAHTTGPCPSHSSLDSPYLFPSPSMTPLYSFVISASCTLPPSFVSSQIPLLDQMLNPGSSVARYRACPRYRWYDMAVCRSIIWMVGTHHDLGRRRCNELAREAEPVCKTKLCVF
jgi:hypothetical protein